jgi:hypothetical protein
MAIIGTENRKSLGRRDYEKLRTYKIKISIYSYRIVVLKKSILNVNSKLE